MFFFGNLGVEVEISLVEVRKPEILSYLQCRNSLPLLFS